jgi:hypothetical protein
VAIEAAHRQHANAGEARVAEGTFGADPGHGGDGRERLFDGREEAQGGVRAALLEVFGNRRLSPTLQAS